jgi:recombination protein U
MSSWNSRGLRGSVLEESINLTNEMYRTKGLALVQKVPTPITPINFDKQKGHITLAYFEQKSTVDYIGVSQEIPICFDAKECAAQSFPLHNIHEHQMQFMGDFEAQGGIAFLIIHFTKLDLYYYVPYRDIVKIWREAKEGGKKSFKYTVLDEKYLIKLEKNVYVHYLPAINTDLSDRENV